MSSSSTRNNNQEPQEEGNLEWLDSFLKRTFFGVCSVHPGLPKSDLNRYCIDCNQSACKYCIASNTHVQHRILKIYRHVYKDVVPVEDMETHIDCSKIQSYRCNKQMVVSLNPLPHCGSGKADRKNSCTVCMRKLMDGDTFDFCSIACKYPVAGDLESEIKEDPESPEEKRHRRKGIPHRAPYF